MQPYLKLSINEISKLQCPICGGSMYVTDKCLYWTYHCRESKFWEHPRGSEEQITLHKHFYQSTVYVKVVEEIEVNKNELP
jgi:hypothetical protein